MKTGKQTMERRTFLTAGVAAGAVALSPAGLSAAPTAGKVISYEGPIPVRPFGKTGYSFPVLGHGGSALMEKEYGYYGLKDVPSYGDRVKMIRDAYEKGIRYFDTARIYQESEKLMGEALKDVQDKIFLASKAMVFEPGKVRESVEASLQDLQMSSIDLIQIHGPVIERLGYDGCMPMYEEMAQLREEGLVRLIGITGHNAFDQMYKLIDSKNFDSVLIEYGYFKKGYNTRHSETQVEWRENCLAKAHELNMGIIAMKVLGAWVFNHNAKNMVADYEVAAMEQLPGAAIRWVLRDERVSVLNIGISYPGDMDRNIAIITGDTTYTESDRMLLADFSAKAYMHESIQKMPVV
ncbi:MAG: hypothetical protein AMXMBFR84_15750 [Candidatus Hydrogenedentota bacterium]